jgi:hypothetical protein
MMKPFFMLPGEPFDFCRDHFHFKVSMEVGVPNVTGRVNDGPEYFVLKAPLCKMILCSLSLREFLPKLFPSGPP